MQEIFANASSFIKKPATLSTLVAEIDKLDWYSARQEGLGDLYEGLAGEERQREEIRRRPVLHAAAAHRQHGRGDAADAATTSSRTRPPAPAASSSPPIATSASTATPTRWTEAQQRKYRRNTFYGMEHVQDTHRLALMNLMLHGLDSDPNGRRHPLRRHALRPKARRCPRRTLILTNPPFGTKKGGGLPTRTDFTFPTSNKQFCFLQHIYRGLKPGGRAAVVLPDNVLFEGNVGKQIRADLMDKCNLHTILRLPTGIFYAQGVKTNVLFFTRGETDKGNTKEVWVYDLRANMPQFGKRTLLTREHFAEFEAAFGDDPLGSAESLTKRKDTGESRPLPPLHPRLDRRARRQPRHHLAQGRERQRHRRAARAGGAGAGGDGRAGRCDGGIARDSGGVGRGR